MIINVVTIGLPGSGKSWWARATAQEIGAVVIERDEIRKSLVPNFSWATWDITMEPVVNKIWGARVSETLASGRPVILADTHLREVHLCTSLRKLGWNAELVIFDTPLEVCRERNARRGPLAIDDGAYKKLFPLFCEMREKLCDHARVIAWP